MSTPFKLFKFLTILVLVYVLVFWPRGIEILAPRSGIEPALPALEGEVLTTGPPGEPQMSLFWLGFIICQMECTASPWSYCYTGQPVAFCSHMCAVLQEQAALLWTAHGKHRMAEIVAALRTQRWPLPTTSCQQEAETSRKWILPTTWMNF